MNILLIGLPGSGKGTQAERLADYFKLFYLQTGDLSRQWAKKDKEIRKIVQSGGLIPEEKMTEFVFEYLDKKKPEGKNILFEGFPRFVDQYKKLEEWLAKRDSKVDAIVYLEIDEEVVVKRLSARRICSKCGEVFNLITNPPKEFGKCDKCGGELITRKDDSAEAVRNRFKAYREATGELVDYLRKEGRFYEIDADRPIEDIFEDIKDKINKFLGK